MKGIDAREAAGAKAEKRRQFYRKKVVQTRGETARSPIPPLGPIGLNSARRSAKPQPQGGSNTAQRATRNETGSKRPPGTGEREEARKKRRRGRSHGRTSWRECGGRRGRQRRRRRRPVAGSRGGAPTGAVAGREVWGWGESETWGGWGARVRGFLSFCIVVGGGGGGGARRGIDCMINGAEEG